jgi:TRAP-type C4-dicarboxylate transport system permease small subunit
LVEGQTTTSTFAPPLWIPYGMMAFGMSLLALQLFVQVLARATNRRSRSAQAIDERKRAAP